MRSDRKTDRKTDIERQIEIQTKIQLARYDTKRDGKTADSKTERQPNMLFFSFNRKTNIYK